MNVFTLALSCASPPEAMPVAEAPVPVTIDVPAPAAPEPAAPVVPPVALPPSIVVKVDPCWTSHVTNEHAVPATVHDLDGNGRDETWSDEWCDYGGCVGPWEAREGERVVAAGFTEIGYSSMIESMEMPPVLVGHPKARKAVEQALGMVVCDAPDPGFARLVGRDLGWIAGTDVEPTGFYWIASESGPRPEWLLYKGHTHTTSAGVTPTTIASVDGLSLVRLAHALVIVDVPNQRHRWVVVNGYNDKLRWPTVGACAALDGHHARVPSVASPFAEDPARSGWDVDLDSGAVTGSTNVPVCPPAQMTRGGR